MINDTKSTAFQSIKFPVLAGIVGGILLTIVLHLEISGWHGLLEYNWRLSGIHAGAGMVLILLCFLLTGVLSVISTTADGLTGKKALLSGILSGIIAGFVFSCSYLYTDIVMNPSNYPPFPGDFLHLQVFFTAISIGWVIFVGVAVFIGMIASAAGALATVFLRQKPGRNSGSRQDDQKGKSINRMILIALPAFIIALLIIPPVIVAVGIAQGSIVQEHPVPFTAGSAGLPALPDQPAGNDHATDVTRWMQDHGGQEVTAAEYLDITNPGYLSSRPDKVREAYSRMKVRVPDLTRPDMGMQPGSRSVAVSVFGFREIPGEIRTGDLGNMTGQCILNESSVAVSNTFAGREMPAGAYLENVCPDFFAGLTESQKAALDNQSLTVSKIPDRQNVSAFVPPRSLSVSRMESFPGWVNLLISGDASLKVYTDWTMDAYFRKTRILV